VTPDEVLQLDRLYGRRLSVGEILDHCRREERARKWAPTCIREPSGVYTNYMTHTHTDNMNVLTNYRPSEDWVLIRRLREDQGKTAGGILLPPTVDITVDTFKGKVLAVGPGRWMKTGERIKPEVKVGDTVEYPCYGQEDIGKYFGFGLDIVQIRESNLLGIWL